MLTDRQVRRILRTLTQDRPELERHKDKRAVTFSAGDKQGLHGAAHTLRRLTCRYCGAGRDQKCRTSSGVVTTPHAVRVDDTWDIVRGRDTYARVVARPKLRRSA